MPRLCIGDGYEFKFTTKPTARTPAVALVYRPPLPVDELTHYDAQGGMDRKGPADRAKELCTFLAAHICSWNATDDKDQPLPVTADNLAAVRDLAFLVQIENELLRSKAEVAAEAGK